MKRLIRYEFTVLKYDGKYENIVARGTCVESAYYVAAQMVSNRPIGDRLITHVWVKSALLPLTFYDTH